MAGGPPQSETLSATIRAADPFAAMPLIDAIAALPSTATGAFLFGPQGRPSGTILVENGRVCWAAAIKMSHRLTDLLKERLDPSLGPNALEGIVQSCRNEGVPLGETLVQRGFVSSDSLRDALRRHTSEAILFLAQRFSDPPVWVDHRFQRYDARFTFGPVEILASIGAACLPELAQTAAVELEKNMRAGSAAVVFTWAGLSAELFPIHEVRGAFLSVRETFDLGAWVGRMLAVQLSMGSVPRLVSALGARGDAVVGWSAEGIVYVVICQNPASLAHVLAKRAEASPDSLNRS